MADLRKTRVSDPRPGKYAKVVAQAAEECGAGFDTSWAWANQPAIRHTPMISDARS